MLTDSSNASLRPFWVATAYANHAAPMPQVEVDLRRIEGTDAHHAESLACHALLQELNSPKVYIICALGKPDMAEAAGQRPPLPPAVPSPAPPPSPSENKRPSPRVLADALAEAKAEVANVRGQLLASLPRGDSGLGAPTYAKLKRALQAANFAVSEAELWNVASTLLGRAVSRVQPLKEADGRAVLTFLESATPERLDLLFPVAPMPEAG